ncbi:MAG: M6 family metalloprotease domain-containing protein [Paludibacter sp.]|nr:M6 family metalloprotease domain-containing protein [Paludibacter sp.]
MKEIFKHIIFSFLFLSSITCLYAIKATPYPVVVDQPDGTKLTIRLNGDEYFNYRSTLDGYSLVKNSEGFLTYAEPDSLGHFKSTNVIAKEIDKRTLIERAYLQGLNKNIDFSKINQLRRSMWKAKSVTETSPQKAYPISGTPKSIVILVNFTDVTFTVANTKTAFTNLLNEKGYATNGGTGSARDYFRDNSTGVFDPEFDVVGPYNLDHDMSYYGANDASDNDSNPRQMVIDACAKAAAAGVDFSQYDTDNDGVVDNVFIYYAGYNEAEGGPENSIWPHRWTLANKSTKFNNVAIYDYACTSELRSSSGQNMCGIGTFCHEFGHVLGLVDYYATDGAEHHTLYTWNIMDTGAYLNNGRTPPSYSAYDRFFIGWLNPVELKDFGEYTLDTLSTTNTAYIITQDGNHNLNGANPSPVEFFTLENRQKVGWDRFLPYHGMLITRIYYNASTWDANTPNNDPLSMGVDIMEADGVATDNSSSGDPFPGAANITEYNLVLRNNTDIHKPLKNIRETNGKIIFNFGSNFTVIEKIDAFSTVQGIPSELQSLIISGSNLTSNISISLSADTLFQIKKDTDSETAWGQSITLITEGTIVSATNIQIRYNPTVPSYTKTHTDKIVFQSGSDYYELALTGTSTRKVSVEKPIAMEPDNITFSGFKANWNTVFDATGYYLTIYSLKDAASILNEGFDNGLTPSKDWTINVSTISSSTIYSGIATPSLQFSNTGESVESQKFLLPAISLSFYIRSMGAKNGGFIVEALTDQNIWEEIDSIPVTTSLNEKNKTYSFSTSNQYYKFRFRYFKGIGSITFDDVAVGFDETIEYIDSDKWVSELSEVVYDLQPNTEYLYFVKASDKNTEFQYENITEMSNTIIVKTLGYPLDSGLLAVPDVEGNVKVFLPTKEAKLYVYDIQGKCVRIISPVTSVFQIFDLPRGHVYILKANNRLIKVII